MAAIINPRDGGMTEEVFPLRLVEAVPGSTASWSNSVAKARVRFWTATEWRRLPDADRPTNVQLLGEGYASLELDWT